ncbi:amino acid ABC transporter substrate-binding protein, PAAT family [Shewanella psychrophila]|uniref:Amino acid ABC transporter substrate-binding protein, PAAT family n=1 Tax=Shewanella psychrophila TaxID=225848 RepID=A0A1S6HM60_9GAMM|nr:transporter substrate-binding domain-containing protein [Shewanella psychrophila]AQS36592.1 amino acid ABC transporter substrate-binding protein, PAAT family [Shewanella psychrophila]
MLLLTLLISSSAKADTLKLTSLHWPPYSGKTLVDQGALIAITRAALNAMGHELLVDFYPWSRAVRLASRDDSMYLGYLPEYSYPTQAFIFSESLGVSPLGLVERQVNPIRWPKLINLNEYTLGVVRDYVNTADLDIMIKQGAQPVEVVSSDEHNIKKVATGRVDGAVIDVHVLRFILAREDLKPLADKLQMNQKLLEEKQLYVAFKNTPDGHKWRSIVNHGLTRIDAKSILDDYMASVTAASQ